ncbi:MAG: hypothetical protein IKR48_06895 [Kiritimatiellae bacterium]|nr:hypothetical protein [Kiritimatiellia bacterium]
MKAIINRLYCGLLVPLVLLASAACAHTEAETNAVAKSMLEFVLLSVNDNLDDAADGVEQEAIVTWPSFLALGESDGWTPPEKKAAFAWYLSMLGTNDCTSLSATDQELVRIALSKCEEFDYAEAVASYKALALNPKGIYRYRAIELAVKYSPFDNSTTEFVETIMTNLTSYSIRESGAASCQYANKLLSFNATNECQQMVVDNAVEMFYRNRMLAPNAFSIVDQLFVRYLDNYSISSNRLEHALNALSLPDCGPMTKRRFVAITNELLSSGQPLPWINFGTGGN